VIHSDITLLIKHPTLLGPSIITSKENYIYCENGWYDTENEVARFSKNAIIVSDKQKLTGDSIYYNRKKGYGRATKNVKIIDTTVQSQSTITGDFAEHYEKGSKSIVTGHAIYGRRIENDTLFMSADTLYYEQPDSTHTYVKAYRHTKNLQNRSYKVYVILSPTICMTR
jgi:lipopolysaccharide assembly outer membrane protein LptD (OstA)